MLRTCVTEWKAAKAGWLKDHGKWAKAILAYRELCDRAPAEYWPFCDGAYCLIQLGRFQEAKEMLLKGPPWSHQHPEVLQHLASIGAALGEHTPERQANRFLSRADSLAVLDEATPDRQASPPPTVWARPDVTTLKMPVKPRPAVPVKPTFSVSNGHPVADNPLRLLTAGLQGECTLKELERNAKTLKLQARQGPRVPDEPTQELCPRQRSAEDYALAQKQVSDPVQLSVALFFWFGDFGAPNPMAAANRWLLEAEGLPQGDGRKAELLTHAIREHDSAGAAKWMLHAVTTAGAMFGAEPDAEEVRVRAGDAVMRIVDRAIADFGDTIEESEIELLNAADDCKRLPQLQNLTRAGDEIVARQLKTVDAYLEAAFAMLNSTGDGAKHHRPLAEIHTLVNQCQDAKSAFGLLQKRPKLLRKMPPDRIVHLSTVCAALGVRLGLEQGRWDEARRLVLGVEPKNISTELETELCQFFQVGCRAIPILCLAASGQNVAAVLDALEREFPRAKRATAVFRAKARVLSEASGRTPAGSVTPPPMSGQSSEPAKGIGRWGCLVLCVAVFGTCAMFMLMSKPATEAPRGKTYRVPRSAAGELNRERGGIEEARRSLDAKVSRLRGLEGQIDSEAALLDRSSASAVARHNQKVQDHNLLREEIRAEDARLQARIDAFNTRLRQNSR